MNITTEKPDFGEVDKAIFLNFALDGAHHAEQRIAERTSMSPKEVLELLNTGRAVRLNNPARHFQRRAYYLLFSLRDNEHFVAVTCPTTETLGTGVIVTVLSQLQYENDHGPIVPENLLKAARPIVDSASYEALRNKFRLQRADGTGLPWRRKDLTVAVYFWGDDYKTICKRVGSPRVPTEHLSQHGLEGVHRHPSFWTWLKGRLETVGIAPDTALDRIEITVAGQEPIQLDYRDPMVADPASFSDSEFDVSAELDAAS